MQQRLAVEGDAAADRHLVCGQQAENGGGGDAFTGTGFSRQRQHFAGRNGQGDVVYRLDVLAVEKHVKVGNLQQAHGCRSLLVRVKEIA